MTEDNAAFTATIKAGPGYEAPWIVIRANTSDEMKTRLQEAYRDLTGPLVMTAQHYAKEYSAFRSGGGQEPGSQTFQGNGNQGGGQQSQPSGNGGGNRYVEEHPKGWGTFEHNHPDAPATMWGPKVLKRAKSQAGKDYAQWMDPRDPGIPSVYKANGKDKPSDLIAPEFANGV